MKPIGFALLALFLAATPRANAASTGEYLARAGDCVVCHSQSDGAPYAGGLKMNTPVGPIFTTNITPDKETGIGLYTFEEFDRALRLGVARDGHRLYPAMPYPSYAKITTEDSRALYDYFMNDVKPVRQVNTPNAIAAPWNARWPLAIWNALGAGTSFRADADHDDLWNRGAYLVQGLAHCGACHTPRGWLFQEKGFDEQSGAFLAGATLDNWSAPNLRGDLNSGLGRWTEAEIAEYLKTGRNRHGRAFGAMRDVVTFSTTTLDDDDIAAMAKYLKSLPPSIDRHQSVWVYDARTRDALSKGGAGAAGYARQCASCHGLDGLGGADMPPLAGNAAILDPDPTSLINIVLNGAPPPDEANANSGDSMPQFRSFLRDRDIADIVTFIRSAWGNRAPAATEARVGELRRDTTAGAERTVIRQMR